MKNSEFRVGSHISVYGNHGIVKAIERLKEYKVDYMGQVIGNGLNVLSDESVERMRAKGYTCEPTGRTATYFTVSFETEESLKGTSYDGGTYGCLDEFGDYGTW